MKLFLFLSDEDGCFVPGNIQGSDLKYSFQHKKTALECQAFCDGYKNCQYWTYHIETNICFPKIGDIDWKKQYDAEKPFTTSGPKKCCFKKGVGLKKGFSLNLYRDVKNVLECQMICQITHNCKFFVLNSNGNCYLKYEFTKRTPNLNAIFGPSDCPNDLDENLPGIY